MRQVSATGTWKVSILSSLYGPKEQGIETLQALGKRHASTAA